VYRKRWVVHIERLTREKVNGVQLRSRNGLDCAAHGVCGCRSPTTYLSLPLPLGLDRQSAGLGYRTTTTILCPEDVGLGGKDCAHSALAQCPHSQSRTACCALASAPAAHTAAARLARSAPRRRAVLLRCVTCRRCAAGATVNVGVDPSKVRITKLKLDKDRRALLERKKGAAAAATKSKLTSAEVSTMENID
jgi:Ribosomal proteins L26 eukaryotic, L24P archaeal